MTIPVRAMEIDTLGDLGAALERQFGSGLEAVLVVRRPDGRRWSSPCRLPQPEDVVRPVAARVLDLAHIPIHLAGRTYMEDALCALAMVHPSRPRMTKELYPAIERKHMAKSGSAERCIRTAVSMALRDYGPAAAAVLGTEASCNTRAHSNSRVLYRLLALIESDLTQGAGR